MSIPDELTINLNWKDKKKEFSFDAVFQAGTSQEKVFADTKHLIQSAVDGYNVCIFAYGEGCIGVPRPVWCVWLAGTRPGNWGAVLAAFAACDGPVSPTRLRGAAAAVCPSPPAVPAPAPAVPAGQTGSGKTYTIYGTDQLPGLTPRGVSELFQILDRDSSKFSAKVSCYMLELYQDDLQDLLTENKRGERLVGGAARAVWRAWHRQAVPRGHSCLPACCRWVLCWSPALLLASPAPPPTYVQMKGPRLEIKKDVKGMVTVPGVTVVENITSARELMGVLEGGQARRHVASTKMNRESSRSHLIMSIVIETTNLQTQNVARGKLSFVDLAGSERWVPERGGGWGRPPP